VGARLNVVFLTVEDPLYLPPFFERVLSERRDIAGVFVVAPVYRNQTPRAAALRYARTFGWRAAMTLARRLAVARIRRESIERVAARHGVPCEHVADVNDDAFLDRLRAAGADLIVSVSCPQLFHKPLIELADRGCLNVHGALLPQYRGVLPSFWMLANGEKEAGVSVFFVNESIDAGELCGQCAFEIEPGESLDAFIHRSKAEAAELVLTVLQQIDDGAVVRQPLDLAAGSYYSWPDRTAVRRLLTAGHSIW
jgi:methionyl-tRNA formyltransferase